jgi:ubiquinone/menaquinone biosynthesis C-methylase UbiE
MRSFSSENINNPAYFDFQFDNKDVDFEHVLRQKKYIELIGFSPNRVIELGCGVSAFCPIAAEMYDEVWGLDYAPRTIRKLRKRFKKVNYVCGDALDTKLQDEYFDAVVAGELIEHIESPKLLLKEMFRICRKGGIVVLSTPHLEFNDPEHLHEFDEADLKTMMGKYGEVTTEIIDSDIFKGRSYIFAKCVKR